MSWHRHVQSTTESKSFKTVRVHSMSHSTVPTMYIRVTLSKVGEVKVPRFVMLPLPSSKTPRDSSSPPWTLAGSEPVGAVSSGPQSNCPCTRLLYPWLLVCFCTIAAAQDLYEAETARQHGHIGQPNDDGGCIHGS